MIEERSMLMTKAKAEAEKGAWVYFFSREKTGLQHSSQVDCRPFARHYYSHTVDGALKGHSAMSHQYSKVICSWTDHDTL